MVGIAFPMQRLNHFSMETQLAFAPAATYRSLLAEPVGLQYVALSVGGWFQVTGSVSRLFE
jgi:hypothetical protein